jgi:hypothetical protein
MCPKAEDPEMYSAHCSAKNIFINDSQHAMGTCCVPSIMVSAEAVQQGVR